MLMTAPIHPYPHIRDCLDSWDSLSIELKAKLIPLFGGEKFLAVVEDHRAILGKIESAKYN